MKKIIDLLQEKILLSPILCMSLILLMRRCISLFAIFLMKSLKLSKIDLMLLNFFLHILDNKLISLQMIIFANT